jgi:hypothetical protein
MCFNFLRSVAGRLRRETRQQRDVFCQQRDVFRRHYHVTPTIDSANSVNIDPHWANVSEALDAKRQAICNGNSGARLFRSWVGA